jgi:LPS-assembly protein
MRRLLVALCLALLAVAARAQEASLVADRLFIDASGRLVAEGNVQAFQDGVTLSASAVAYDPATERLTIEGPILIREPSGAILTATRAELDPRLEDGLLRGARLVLDRQLQIAANRIDRVGGLTALTGAAATSCQVCPGRRPLWEITATRVVRDEAAGFLHFDDATFRIRGTPILWLPRLRLPDPGNTRATGLLVPSFRTTDRLGPGIRLPFFVPLGPSRDITFTPYLSPATRTLEARYRQAFLAGELTLRGAITADDLEPGDPRGFVQALGRFEIVAGTVLTFDLASVSDEAYLIDYGWSDADRLASSVRIERATGRDLLVGEITVIRSFRDGDDAGSLPPVLGDFAWDRRWALGGGFLTAGIGADGHLRPAEGSPDAARDGLRFGAYADWRGGRVFGPGLLVEGQARIDLDTWRIADDPDFPSPIARVTPAAAATFRFPLVRHEGATSDLLQPVLSFGWTAAWGDDPPDEDSSLAELDGGNLHALRRLPGEDRVEQGARLSYGLAWTREAGGYAATALIGRVVREVPAPATAASGLAGVTSDTLAEARLDLADGFALTARTLLDDWSFGKSEARIDWTGAAVTLSASYVHLPTDLDEGRETAAAEWTIDGEWRPSDRWALRAGGRYDLVAEAPARATAGVVWRNECVEVDLSATRRYTDSRSQGPSTDFGLAVNLLGFQAGGQGARPGACRE